MSITLWRVRFSEDRGTPEFRWFVTEAEALAKAAESDPEDDETDGVVTAVEIPMSAKRLAALLNTYPSSACDC